ncbi:MAG: IS3 family transposase, partial [Candidatus Dormibacteraceae bacterium]
RDRARRSAPEMTRYIETNRERFGVEPICRELQVAPSTYYAARNRPPSVRATRDEELRGEIERVNAGTFEVYGARKMWLQLRREQVKVGRDRVARLMKAIGLSGVSRGSAKRVTTFPSPVAQRPGDLVERKFTSSAPNRLWVSDLTYVATWSGFCYVAFVIDAFSRRIVGWRVAASLRAELALDALEMAIWSRRGQTLDGLIHHSDRGVQFLAIRYSERLTDEGAITSVGSKGSALDNALAETVNGLFKTELIRRKGPWKTVDDVELATLAWVDWWNHRRLHGACGDIPPAEYEENYYRKLEIAA